MYQFCYVEILSTNQYRNLLSLDDPGRVRSQIISVVYQIQRFDFGSDAKSNNMNTPTFYTFKTSSYLGHNKSYCGPPWCMTLYVDHSEAKPDFNTNCSLA
jgi:hypothetical protein